MSGRAYVMQIAPGDAGVLFSPPPYSVGAPVRRGGFVLFVSVVDAHQGAEACALGVECRTR